MTVQVYSQPVTDHIMCYNDMCFIYNSISCLENKTTFGTHEQTYYVNVGLNEIIDLKIQHFKNLTLSNIYIFGKHEQTYYVVCNVGLNKIIDLKIQHFKNLTLTNTCIFVPLNPSLHSVFMIKILNIYTA